MLVYRKHQAGDFLPKIYEATALRTCRRTTRKRIVDIRNALVRYCVGYKLMNLDNNNRLNILTLPKRFQFTISKPSHRVRY
jgi:hypothetical protein